jgi:hypothetical protein
MPVSMTDIAMSLSQMSRALATAQFELDELEAKAVQAREAHTMAYAVEYLKSGEEMENGKPPSVETRKARTVLATHKERLAMESTDGRLRNKRGEIAAIKIRIDCARSSGTLLRAEIELDRVR